MPKGKSELAERHRKDILTVMEVGRPYTAEDIVVRLHAVGLWPNITRRQVAAALKSMVQSGAIVTEDRHTRPISVDYTLVREE